MDHSKLLLRRRFAKRIYVTLLTTSFLWLLLGEFLLVSNNSHKRGNMARNHSLSDEVIFINTGDDLEEIRTSSVNITRFSNSAITASSIQVSSAFKSNMDIYGPSHERFHFRKSPNNMPPFNCNALSNLEKRIAHSETTFVENETATLQNQHISYALISHIKNSTDNQGDNKLFERALETLYILLQAHDWPGVPKILGACIKNKQNNDVTIQKTHHKEAWSIRYVREEPATSFPLCRPNIPNDCESFKSLRKFLTYLHNPLQAALKIMRSFAVAFENFYQKGAIPTRMKISDVIVTKDYKIIFTSVRSLAFLDNIKTSHKRLLSGITCRLSSNCPRFVKQQQQDVAKSCFEFQGHCDTNNRCWGVDANSYLCYLSRSLFAQLFQFVKTKLQHGDELSDLDAILKCTSQSIPEHRCDWSALKNVIDDIIKIKKFSK